VLLALSKYNSVIEELRRASLLPYSRFPLNDTPRSENNYIHVQTLRECAQVLQLRALAELENGQSEKALDDVKLIFYLSSSIHGEPVYFSQYARLVIFNMAIQPIWEGMAGHEWTNSQIAIIESELSKFDFLSDYQFCIRAERAQDINFVDYVAQRRNIDFSTWEFLDDAEEVEKVAWWERIMIKAFDDSIPKGWFCQNDLTIAQILQQALRTERELRLHILSREVVLRSDNTTKTESQHFFPYWCLAELQVSGFSSVSRLFAFAQCSADLARVACALERYRLAHGQYPDSLEVLVPVFIDKLPHDIINGDPLKYRRTQDGQFVLYSIGWKEKDAGGTIILVEGSYPEARINLNKSDWVWRYPAK
jgi:hypothetical protein